MSSIWAAPLGGFVVMLITLSAVYRRYRTVRAAAIRRGGAEATWASERQRLNAVLRWLVMECVMLAVSVFLADARWLGATPLVRVWLAMGALLLSPVGLVLFALTVPKLQVPQDERE